MSERPERPDCVWAPDYDGNYWTACGEGHTLIDGTPTENDMRWCCYCGGKLVEAQEPTP